jgi:hypothetical protein
MRRTQHSLDTNQRSGIVLRQIRRLHILPARGARGAVYPRAGRGSLQKRLVMATKAKYSLVELRESFIAEWIRAKAAHFDSKVRHQKWICHLSPSSEGSCGWHSPIRRET